MTHDVSESELLAFAKSEGVAVTPDQLKRWRKAKLLPAVRRRGLGRGAGTETLYPPEAKRWVVDLAKLLEADRSLNRAGWSLWLKGYPLTEHARAWLLDVARLLQTALFRLAIGDFDGSAKAGHLHHEPVVRAPLRAITGQLLDLSDEQEFDRLLTESMHEAGFSEEHTEPPFDFSVFGGQLERLEAELKTASPDALLATRDQVLLLRFVLGFLVNQEEVPPTAFLFLVWFGLMQMTDFGPQFLDGVGRAIRDRNVPQLLEEMRPFVATLSIVLRRLQPLQSLAW